MNEEDGIVCRTYFTRETSVFGFTDDLGSSVVYIRLTRLALSWLSGPSNSSPLTKSRSLDLCYFSSSLTSSLLLFMGWIPLDDNKSKSVNNGIFFHPGPKDWKVKKKSFSVYRYKKTTLTC